MNISAIRLQELEMAERRLKELEYRQVISEPVQQFCASMGTVLAATPYHLWPEFAKTCLRYSMPESLRIVYISRLPSA